MTPILIFTCALLLLAAFGCRKPQDAPDVAGKIQMERSRIDETNPAPPRTEKQIEEAADANQAYWLEYCSRFGEGDNFRLDGRPYLADMPKGHVTDPLLIQIHNTTADMIEKMRVELEAQARGQPAPHPTALEQEMFTKLKPLLAKASKKYGIPERSKDSQLLHDTAPPTQTNP